MEIFKAALTSSLSIIILFILSKIMGSRQIAQLTMFDYIVGITIGSIASEMAVGKWTDMLTPIVAMTVYAVITVILNYATNKSIKFRRIITGETLILMEAQKIYKDNLKKAKMDLSEFLSELRKNGYFHLSDVEMVILEPNGSMSIMPVWDTKPLTPKDMNIPPQQDRPEVNVILDGAVLEDNLKYTGNNHTWLEKELHAQGISDSKKIILATCDINNKLSIYLQNNKPMSRDMFQ